MKLRNMFTTCYCSEGKNDNTGIVPEETGYDRVKRMFRKTDFGFISPEEHYLVNNATAAVSISAFFGALIHSVKAKEDYLRRNVASQFESQHLARRSLVDAITLAAIKGGLKYGVKYGSFSTLYLLSTMAAANYNNKITVWEHIGSGALIGGLFRIKYGLKGMTAAASAGAVLGAFAGGILVFSMWLTNTSFQDLRSSQREMYFESRKQKFEIDRNDLIKR